MIKVLKPIKIIRLKKVWMHLNWVQSFVLTGGSDWERQKKNNELKDYGVWKLTWAKKYCNSIRPCTFELLQSILFPQKLVFGLNDTFKNKERENWPHMPFHRFLSLSTM